jgi:hypothetical protein
MSSTVFEDVGELESRLGLPSNFYKQLLQEDDWSFVIKLNALFEGACTHVLTVRLHAPELNEAFAYLELANAKYGKVELLKSLGSITSEQAKILCSLATLRNTLVHNIANVGFSFKSHVADLDSNQLKSLVKNFGHGVQDTIEIARKKIPKAQFVRENPKLSLWLTAAEVLACLYLELEAVELHLRKSALAKYAALARESNALLQKQPE